MRVSVIINPVSGRGATPARARRRAELAKSRLAGRGIEPDVLVTGHPRHAFDLASRAVAAGADVVAAWGGDGTMNEVASAVAGSTAALGLIPGGSGNGLARELGIPLAAEAALDVLVDGRDRTIDYGLLDGRPFFNVAGLGLDARVAADFQARGQRGLLSYALKTAAAIVSPEVTTCTLDAGGTRARVDALLVAFANSRQYGNDVLIAPGALLDDGAIDIVVIPHRPFGWRVRHVPSLLSGTVDRVPGVTVHRCGSAVVESAGPLAYHLDGEPHLGGCQLRLETRASGVRIRVPAYSTKR